MAKAAQSKSKTAYRTFVTNTRLLIEFYSAQPVHDPSEMQNQITELKGRLQGEFGFVFADVASSNTRSVDLWEGRFQERIDYAIDQVYEAYYKQLDEGNDDVDEELRRDAAAFGTNVETWLDFLGLDIAWLISTARGISERATVYTDLRDVINDFGHIASAIEHVRYSGGFYYLTVTESGRGRRRSKKQGSAA
jgi:hypothetical protein